MKLCIAGTGAITDENKKECENIKYVLESFYYFKNWQKKLIKTADLFLLDSGAFTFMNNFKGSINWEKYIDEYCDFIIENDIKYFFELDIDVVVGYEKVKEIRKYIENKTGKKCIPVWHKSRGLEEWKKLTKEYDYVAIGGFAIKVIKKSDYKYIPELLRIAKENNCKVHGLGFTNLKLLEKFHFYSVDSTSWKSGNRFGTLYKFENDELKQYKKPENKRVKSSNGWYSKVELHNLKEWLKLQEYARLNY